MDATSFELAVLPHLESARVAARCLLRDEHDAEDAVQDAVVRALRYFDDDIVDVRAWLLTIVRRCCIDGRSRAVCRLTDEELLSIPDPTPGPDAYAHASILRERIGQAIDALPARFREVIVLREVQSLSYDEISRTAGISTGTVMSRLSRARLRLRCLLANAV